MGYFYNTDHLTLNYFKMWILPNILKITSSTCKYNLAKNMQYQRHNIQGYVKMPRKLRVSLDCK